MSIDDKKGKGVVDMKPPFANKRKFEGTISYSSYIGNWRCIDVNGRCVLSTGSLELAKSTYPRFEVING